jgi:hypothetical protein
LGHSFGCVPGVQTVPRSEATSILHALRTTKGNATFVCDNWSVVAAWHKGDSYCPQSNGLLWQAIGTSRKERLAKGYGFLEVVWIKSHLSYEQAINRGYDHFWWIANSFAGRLAEQAAKECQPDHATVYNLRDRLTKVLKHHVEIAVFLAPIGGRTPQSCQVAQPKVSKSDRVRQLAREACHRCRLAFKVHGKCGGTLPQH